MYQIDIGKFKQLLQTVTNFRTSLEATNDFLGTQVAAIRECSSGEVRATFIEGMMLLRTEYYNEIQRIRSIETVLTDALNNAVLLKDRIRKLENVARGEDVYYGEGVLANEAEYDGIIAFDESTIENVAWLCSNMTDYADQLETMINGVQDSVSGLVDLEMEADQLRADCNKARIASAYGMAYNKIGELMEALNEQVKTGLAPYTPEDYKEVTTETVKASYARYAGRDSLEGLLATGTEQEKYQKTLELLKQENLSDEEELFLCVCLESYCETKDATKLEGFLGALVSDNYEVRQTLNEPEVIYYITGLNQERIGDLLNKADETGNTQAYGYLLAAKQIIPSPLRAGEKGVGYCEPCWCEREDGSQVLQLSVITDEQEAGFWATTSSPGVIPHVLDQSGLSEKWSKTIEGIKGGIQHAKKIHNNFLEDIENFDISNQSEEVVLESHYFSGYKDVFVIKAPIGQSGFSFGVIFMGNKLSTDDDIMVQHEYGHTVQLENMGAILYTTKVVVPSITAYHLNQQGKLPYEYYGSPWEAEADQLGGVNRTYNNTPWPEEACDSYWDLIKLWFE